MRNRPWLHVKPPWTSTLAMLTSRGECLALQGRPFAQTAWGEIAPSSPWIGGKRTCSPLPRIWIRPQRAPRSPLCAFAFCRITHCGLPACGYTGKLCSSSTPLRVPPPVRRIATRSRSLPGMVQSIALQWHPAVSWSSTVDLLRPSIKVSHPPIHKFPPIILSPFFPGFLLQTPCAFLFFLHQLPHIRPAV